MSEQPNNDAPDGERLEDLDERIRQVRSEAEEVLTGPDEEAGERSHESGDAGDESDDQAITPPG